MEIGRIATHVGGLDEILGGGLPEGHVVLLSGLPGTMKSSLAYAILSANARMRHAKCVYVSLEQTRSNLEILMEAMGFPVQETVGDVHVLDVGTIQKDLGKDAVKPWIDFLQRTLLTMKEIDRTDLVVIDSLEALEVLAGFSDRRADLFRLFEWLRDFGATTLIVTEATPEGMILGFDGISAHRDETFLADGIIELKMHHVSDAEVQRRIRVLKMRGTKHGTGFHVLMFESGQFQVTPVMSP